RVRLLLRAHAGAQEPARVDQVERADRECLSLGPALAPPAGPRLPDRQAAQPPPGVVPEGLPRATRAASSWRDPPRRGGVPAAQRSAPRARAAGELGGHGKARTRAITTFDNRGVGASTGKTPDTIQAMAKDAVTFIRALGFDQVDLHGFSMGGMIAQLIARVEPELVRKLVHGSLAPRFADSAC